MLLLGCCPVLIYVQGLSTSCRASPFNIAIQTGQHDGIAIVVSQLEGPAGDRRVRDYLGDKRLILAAPRTQQLLITYSGASVMTVGSANRRIIEFISLAG